MEKDDKKKRGPLIVETGSDDPSTVSPPIEVPMEPETKPDPVMGQTAMGDVAGIPETPETPLEPGPYAYGADKPTKFVAPFPIAEAGAAPETPPAMATPALPPPVQIGPVTTTERTKLSAEAKQGQAEQLAAAHEGEGIASREGDQGVGVAKANADLAAEEERQKEIARRQEMEDRAREKAKYEAGLAERDRILNDAEKVAHKDYWSDKSAGAHLLSMFSTALGEAVSVDTGRNGAQEELDKNLARDDAKKQSILKQAIYRSGLKGADAKEAYENGLMEIGLRKAAVLDKLADHRASVMASKGFDAAQVAKDKLINAAKTTSAKLKTDFGDMLNVKVHSSNQLQQEYKMKSALEAERLAAGAGNQRVSPVLIQKANAAEHGRNAMAVIEEQHKKGIELTDEEKTAVQKATREMEIRKHGGMLTNMLPSAILARSELQSLSPEKQKLATAYMTLAQNYAVALSPSSAESEMRNTRDQVDLMKPGDSPEVLQTKLNFARQQLGSSGAFGNSGKTKYTDIARQGAESAMAEAPRQVQAPVTSQDRARLVAWARGNPNAPGAKEALAKFGGK